MRDQIRPELAGYVVEPSESPKSLRLRFRQAYAAFRGKDVLYDQGMRHRAADGTILTLAKLPLAVWVATEDPDLAYGSVAAEIEDVFGLVDWTDPHAREAIDKFRAERERVGGDDAARTEEAEAERDEALARRVLVGSWPREVAAELRKMPHTATAEELLALADWLEEGERGPKKHEGPGNGKAA